MLISYGLSLGSADKVDEIRHPEPLPGPVDSTQRFLRDDRAVERLRNGYAVVAVSAVAFEFLRKVVEQISSPASSEVAKLTHLIELFEHYFALDNVSLDLCKTLELGNVGPGEKKQRLAL